MKIALVADTYPPLRSSGAVQMRDLSMEFARQGHEVTVIVASPQQIERCQIEFSQGVQILRLKTPCIKNIGYIRRSLAELLMPFFMMRNYSGSCLSSVTWDAIAWYSPSIFFGPFVQKLSAKSKCPSYLIIRDIFPEWAVDMGLMRKGIPYLFFKAVAHYQYSVANVIGVQTAGNLPYFDRWAGEGKRKLQVLENWLSDEAPGNCTISIQNTILSGRKIFVYAGNMGVAQGMSHVIDFVDSMQKHTDVGFVFVGRGSESEMLRNEANKRALCNILFFDEIDPIEIPGLYAQCHVGIVSLDFRHKTHNIPGKFISYMQSGLPVFAMINPGNDLERLIDLSAVGVVATKRDMADLVLKASELLQMLDNSDQISKRCRDLYLSYFSPQSAVKKIVEAVTL